jgi:hypothetical protein
MLNRVPEGAVQLHYFRRAGQMSLRRKFFSSILCSAFASAGLLASLPVCAQYPGQITKTGKETPELRSIAVLEWTGEAGKPKASRLVPVAVLDEGRLQDGSIYLSRPWPLALSGGVEYELQQNGQPIGLFDVGNAGQELGSWVGLGAWKPMPKFKPKAAAPLKIDDDAQSDTPVLHRKHHADDAPSSSSGSDAGSGSTEAAPADDPDRPKLHKKDSSGGDASTTGSQSDSEKPTLHKKDDSASSSDADTANTASSTTSDPDRPTLHKKDTSDTAESSAPPDDPDRPVLKKSKKKPPEDISSVASVDDATDPDRPRLKRGKFSGDALVVAPTLIGMPPDLQQAVAVSDQKSRPEHPWSYAWANPDDEEKMKSALEDLARDALGLTAPPPPPAPKKPATRRTAKAPRPVEPPPPAPLLDEQYRVLELAYGSGATLVLSAHTDGSGVQQKFVTLVAQPDLYGNVKVLLKNVTDAAHLDNTPRMRLVDAVDAMADNRGELLFELRGATGRQFVLYRVLRGQAEKLFAGGGGDYGSVRE